MAFEGLSLPEKLYVEHVNSIVYWPLFITVGGDNEGDGEEINQVFTGELIKEENVEENINENYEDLHQEAMGDIEAIADNDGDNEDDSDEDYIVSTSDRKSWKCLNSTKNYLTLTRLKYFV